MTKYQRLFALLLTSLLICCAHGSHIRNLNQKSSSKLRSQKLDSIFDNSTLGETTLTVSEEEWNKLLSYTHSKNYSINIKGDYTYQKNGKTYNMKEIALRVRGNTSKQPPEKTKTHNTENPQYQQAHFRLKFTEYHDEDDSPENKKIYHMEGAAKGMNIKYMKSDKSYVQEVYSYDLFQRFGVWTSPRASYTKLYVTVGNSKKAYFGMYKATEQINKQYLKARVGKDLFSNDDGNLWKCLYQYTGPADLKPSNLDKKIAEEYWNDTDKKYYTPTYTLKTNDKTENDKQKAETELREFITKLNDKTGVEFENWIEGAFDVDGYLRTVAVNVAVGMWDDYWSNYNNYYLYFDGTGKAFFIPYDYDNTLGVTNSGLMLDPGRKNPLEWGKTGADDAPLTNKILAIKKYNDQYKEYLRELIDPKNDLFDANRSEARIEKWYEQIEAGSDKNLYDVSYRKGRSDWDITKWYSSSLYMLNGDSKNYFKVRTTAIKRALGMEVSVEEQKNIVQELPKNLYERLGYRFDGDKIIFIFNPNIYNMKQEGITAVSLRASFNEWGAENPKYPLKKQADGTWTTTLDKSIAINKEFKYSTNIKEWIGASNMMPDYAIPAEYQRETNIKILEQ